jgi:hypothetical protein
MGSNGSADGSEGILSRLSLGRRLEGIMSDSQETVAIAGHRGDLVSVVVPCHNRVDYLRQALESVAEQDYEAIEVIIVDDASTDMLESAIGSIEWPGSVHARYVRSEVNVGPGACRELGRRASRGSYIAYLDSDDLWHPHKVSAQVAALQAHPGAGFCYCISRPFTVSIDAAVTGPLRGSKTLRQILPDLLYGRHWHTSSCMWTREASDRIGPWLSAWTWEDYEYDFRAGCEGVEPTHVAEVLSYHRIQHGGEQLSRVATARAAKQRSESVLAMARSAVRYPVAYDRVLRSRVAQLLIAQAAHLLDAHDCDAAVACAAASRKLVARYPLSWSAAAAVQIAAQCMRPATAARVARRLKGLLA